MRLSLLLSLLRPAGPVAIGVSLGFTLSLLSGTWVEEPCGAPPRTDARPRSAASASASASSSAAAGSPLGPVGGPQDGGRHNGNAARRPNAVPAGLGAESWEPRVVPYRPPSPGRAAKKAVRCGERGEMGMGMGIGGAGGELQLPGGCCPRVVPLWAAGGLPRGPELQQCPGTPPCGPFPVAPSP